MKAPDPTDSSDSLSRVLKDWRVVPSRTPQFRTEVWARIGGAGKTESWAGYLRGRSTAVAGGLALALVLGAVGGRIQARSLAATERARLASAYVQALDARSIVMR
ncbi:MAG: hypothetical protein CK548_04015 [Opitutia bacterium]|nr:hypothetical protein [Opitutaceae bacterium]PHX72499.1 MAG: hypothetical protein CK548_04015 [Opitutae bacterium]